MNRVAVLTMTLLAIALSPAFATTWHQTEIDDPIAKSARCQINEPSSFGSYIYHWPSKYDQVFWPTTEDSGIGFCAESGFAAFIGEFDDISETQRAEIAAYLSMSYQRGEKEPDRSKKLELLEGCYARRELSAERQIHLLRSLAYQYETLGDQVSADSRRRQALEQIRVALTGELKENRRLEYLFVAAAYEREFGEVEASKAHEKLLRSALKNANTDDSKGYVIYLGELADDLSRIEPGGKLAPPERKDEAHSDS